MALPENKQAPEFSLFNTEKNEISLKDQRGKNVLLLFFPLAFTGTCTKELCSVRDDIGKYDNENVQVFGISVDSIFSLAKYKQEQHFNYPLLSDFNKEVSEKYNTIYRSFTDMDMHGVSKRSAFIIDKTGNVVYEEILEKATDIPDFAM